MRRIRLALLSFIGLGASVVQASPPTLLADLNSTLAPRSSGPGRISWTTGSVQPSDFTLVRTTNSQLPMAVWMTDGLPGGAGTRQITGITPVLFPAQALTLSASRNVAGAMTLSVTRSGAGTLVYVIDPVSAQATLIAESAGATAPIHVGGRFIYLYDDGVHGRELWSTDGTPGAASLLADLSQGSAETSITILVSNGAKAWLSVKLAGDTVRRLWVTDGTAGGTVPIGPLSPTANDASTFTSTVLGDGLLYTARDNAATSTRLYFATASSPAASPVMSGAVPVTLQTGSLASAGSHAVFVGADANTTERQFVTDGLTATEISTTALGYFPTPTVVSDPAAPFGWVMYYAGGPTASNTEPCRTDGTPGGTYQIADLNPGASPSSPSNFIGVGTRAYFRTTTYITETFAYYGTFMVSDGTAAGTLDLGTLPGAPAAGTIAPLATLGGQLLCSGTDARGSELWLFDPAANTFAFVADLNPGEASSNQPLILAADSTTALLGSSGTSSFLPMHITDGTTAGTLPAISGGQPLGGSIFTCPTTLGVFGDSFAAFAGTSPTTEEPWLIHRTTGAGTILRDIRPGGQGSNVASTFTSSVASACMGSFTAATLPNGRVAFVAAPAIPSLAVYSVYSTDGTTAGTIELSQHRRETGFPTLLFNFSTLGPKAYFFAPPLATEFSQFDVDLWATDGTAAGTTRAVPLRPLGITSQWPTQLVVANGRLYFTVAVGGSNRLFSSGGTAATTAQVDLGPSMSGLAVTAIIPTEFGLFFLASGSDLRTRLGFTDGSSPAATRLLIPDSPDLRYAGLTTTYHESDGRLFFSMWTRAHGRELWVTDGTAAGTRRVTDLNPGPGSSDPTILRNVEGGRVVFSAYTPDRGLELWQSDGSAGGFGTRLIADLQPGPASSAPTNAALIGANLIFAADDGSSLGREFWTTRLSAVCRCDVDNSGATGIQDLFNYLSLYFTGAGDFNGDGQNTVVDVFDFLGCWFVGCE